MNTPIYLDNHSTTSCDPRVVEKMLPYFSKNFGNAASVHTHGKKALEAVEEARSRVADLIGASSGEIIFTSGATESINMTVVGIARAYKEQGNHLITVATEHKAVLYSHKALEQEGFRVTVLPVDRYGKLNPTQLEEAITPETILVSVMLANNEIGTIHPFEAIQDITRKRGLLWNCDAVQAVGKIPVNVESMGIDLLPLSAHKIYGPKGIGALYIRKKNPRIRFMPSMMGGGQERGLRSGTLNVPSIVGLGEACAIAQAELEKESKRILKLRDLLEKKLNSDVDGVQVNGHPKERIPNNLSVSFQGVDGEMLLRTVFEEVSVSSGATCTATTVEPSHVLTAIGLNPELAKSTIRFGLGRFNTEEEVQNAADVLIRNVKKLRNRA